jgi:gliding motility-associated-like protein
MNRKKKLLFSIFSIIICCYTTNAQLTVSGGLTAQDIANVIAGGGLTISNAQINCSANGYGTFNSNNTNLGINSGIMLTTGTINQAIGPNNTGSSSVDNGTSYSDPDLVAIEPQATYDPCILTFDVVPTCDTLSINYVFASEEYPEFVCSSYNDAFGFFVSGPNPSGGNYNSVNIATVPGTTTLVAINSVNGGSVGANGTPGGCTSLTNTQYYVDNTNGQYIQYDGFTVPLTAKIAVVPCQTYSIKLAIADAGDGIYDSGVFLTENGFTCPGDKIQVSSTPANCGSNDGSATASVTGATPPVTYQWSANANNQTTATATGLSAGTYSVTATDGGGCVYSDTVTVNNINSNMSASSTCSNASSTGATDGSSTANATGGNTPYTYSWNTSPAQTTQTATGLGAGTYTVTITDATGCSATATCVVNEPPFCFTVTLTPTHIKCFGQNNGSITSTVSAGGTTPYSYNWSNGATTPNISGLAPGTYSVTVTDASSCNDIASVTITQPASPLSNSLATSNPNCYGKCNGVAIATPSGGTSPYSYNWSSGQITSNATNLCAGSFSITVTDSNACTVTNNFTITQPQPISSTVSSTNNNCGQPDGTATVSNVTGGGSPGTYSYLWSASAGSQSSATATGLVSGTYTVTITSGQCDTTASVVVNETPPPTAFATGTSTTCNGVCDATATVTPSGGTNPQNYGYNWTNGQTTQTATGLCAGSYSVTVTDLNNNCKVVTSANISQPTQVTVITSKDTTICVQSNATISASASGGNSPYNYTWDNGFTGSGPHIVSPSSVQCYSVTATDVNGCPSFPATVCVSLYDPIVVTGFTDQTICPGNSVDISALATGGIIPPNYSYSWNNGATTGPFVTLTPTGTQGDTVTYMVVASDNCSPNDTDYVDITFFPIPDPSFTPDSTFGCAPIKVTFIRKDTIPSSTCLWDLGDGTIVTGCDSVPHTYSTPGTYYITLTIVSTDGCKSITTPPGQVVVNPNPIADFTMSPNPTDIQNLLISFTDLSQGNINQWNWTFYNNDSSNIIGTSNLQNPTYNFASNQQNPFIYFIEDSGIYPVHLLVKTLFGCTDDTTLYLEVNPIFYVNIPNAFTPNGDGKNDFFFPVGIGIDPYRNYNFYIFNRWGDMIFESHALDDPWDGTARALGGNAIVPQDVYVWKLEVQEVGGKNIKHRFVGHVTLIRN